MRAVGSLRLFRTLGVTRVLPCDRVLRRHFLDASPYAKAFACSWITGMNLNIRMVL
jgi:hypothetical protein